MVPAELVRGEESRVRQVESARGELAIETNQHCGLWRVSGRLQRDALLPGEGHLTATAYLIRAGDAEVNRSGNKVVETKVVVSALRGDGVAICVVAREAEPRLGVFGQSQRVEDSARVRIDCDAQFDLPFPGI